MSSDHFILTGASSFQLTSTPTSVGDYCQGPVSFECVAVGILPTLLWLANSTETIFARHAVVLEDPFPVTLTTSGSLRGVTVQITNASRNKDNANSFDVTSLIFAEDATVLDGWSLACADTNRNGSETLSIRVRSLSEI